MKHPAWPVLRQALSLAFFAVVIVLLAVLLRHIDWSEGWETLRATSGRTLLAAGAVALGGHAIYASFDLLGKSYARHHLPPAQIVPVTFVCYAFNLNLGAWVGSIAFRYRLYARLGLDQADITRIFTLSVLTNWVGYLVLAGAVFTLGDMPIPAGWRVNGAGLRLLGAALLAGAAAYLVACSLSRRRSFSVRGHVVELPSGRLALAQIGLGAANWCAMALVIYLLLQEHVAYPTVLGVLLLAAIATLITHVPGGLGVLEAVFIALLEPQVPRATLLAALIGYRAIYFLGPLFLAILVFAGIETRAKRLRRRNGDGAPTPVPPPRARLDLDAR